MSVLPFRRQPQPVADRNVDGDLVDTEFGPIPVAEVVRLFGAPVDAHVASMTDRSDLDAS